MQMDQQKLGLFTIQQYTGELNVNTLLHGCVCARAGRKRDALAANLGDLWMSNILFRVDDDQSVTNQIVALLDWQTLVEGNPLFDLGASI